MKRHLQAIYGTHSACLSTHVGAGFAPFSHTRTMSDEGGRRPRRAASRAAERTLQKAAGTNLVPSAMHYVGYVEEDETPEMIMAKFAHLEQIQKEQEEAKKTAAEAKAAAKAAAAADGEDGDVVMDDDHDKENGDEKPDFDEEMLLKVFKQTSNFSLKSAIKDDLYGDDHMLDRLEGNAVGFYDSDNEGGADEFWSEILGAAKKKRRVGGPRVPREPRAPKPQKSHMITAYNSDNQMLMRKKKVIDPREPNILKLPAHPIPESWGKVIRPYRPPSEIEAEKLALPDCEQHVMDIAKNCEKLTELGTNFLAVHANPPWAIDDSPDKGSITVEMVAKIPFHKLAPYGFVFMWVEKENLSAVCDAMMDQNFVYVENMTWVQMTPNNTVAGAAARYLRRSHRTMLMFRRDVRKYPEAKEVELRHQRTADVTLDVLQTSSTGRRVVPQHVYKAMETLLPEAYKAGYKGRLLELWSEPGAEARRSGWTLVADGKDKGKK